ncbi:MAG TPA: amidohydrolase family protein [Thermoanaerobaculia bacterium]|nr:amidohydrolase family protein [Thermoanaerobaculia bacterium]
MPRPRRTPFVLALALATSCFTLAAIAVGPAHAQRTLLHAGSVLDVETGRLLERRTLVIENGRIVEVTEGFSSAGDGDKIVDLRGHTLLPGLMDMHVHLTSESSPGSYAEDIRLNAPDFALRGVVYARRTLEAGFTTVRDLGGDPTAIKALRDAIDQGWIPGPKVYAATSSLASTGGHGDPTNGLRAELTGDPGAAIGIVNGVEDARKAVRQRYKEGADLIKITATGGVLSLAKSGLNAQFAEEEIRAIVDTARDYGFHVAAHAHGLEGIKRAVRAGVTTIEHGTYMDEEAFALLKQHDTYFVPTISAGRFVAEKAAVPGYFPEIVRPKAAAIGPLIQDTFGKAYRAGVKIAFGTDCGVCPHGSNAKELEYMVEAGMPALEAIRSATTTTATLLGIAAEVGTLTPGKRADVIAVEGNPLDDVKRLQEVRFVMKGGVVYKAPGQLAGAEATATASGR